MLAICVVNTFDELQLPLILYQPMTSCLDMVVKLVTSQNIVSYMDGSLIIAIPIIFIIDLGELKLCMANPILPG